MTNYPKTLEILRRTDLKYREGFLEALFSKAKVMIVNYRIDCEKETGKINIDLRVPKQLSWFYSDPWIHYGIELILPAGDIETIFSEADNK